MPVSLSEQLLGGTFIRVISTLVGFYLRKQALEHKQTQRHPSGNKYMVSIRCSKEI